MVDSRRGRWSRAVSRGERQARARQPVLDTTAQALATGEATATDIVLRAGVGRSTFYEHFEDVDDAVSAATREASERVRASLRAAVEHAHTPRERRRARAAAWVAEVSRAPAAAGLLEQSGPAGEYLREELQTTLELARR